MTPVKLAVPQSITFCGLLIAILLAFSCSAFCEEPFQISSVLVDYQNGPVAGLAILVVSTMIVGFGNYLSGQQAISH